ncbi:tape measure protein [Curvibacter sp. HBC28]|uniref:Tape measure protein n=1 Tax=Curvibacter microcysteis TaxID=3026419 RepID=A0ABT5MEI8_9BURK|nr:tape measure protein [Curvibacter sp. HBC28]MDD0814289.1 tape measure protein [Curvibacter sp. HBC28]
MASDLNTEIKIGADASGVEAGVGKAKRSLRELGESAKAAGDSVAASGDKAGKSLASMGDGGEVASRKIQRDTASMQGSLQRYISTLEAGSKDSRKYWETMADFKGVDKNALRPLLDQLDSYKAKTVAATEATATWTSSLTQIGSGVAGVTAVAVAAGLAGKAMFDASANAERLRTMLDFSTGGKSAKEIEYLRGVTYRLGLEFSSTAKAYGQFQAAAKGTALEGDKARAVFESVAKASAVMGLSAEDTSGVLLALQQMISKGTVQAEELRGQLGERLPGAFQVAASAMGVTTAELGKMLEQGQVVADDFLPKFGKALEKNLGGAAEKAADRLDAAVNRFETSWTRLKQAGGDSGISKAFSDGLNSGAGSLEAIAVAMERARINGDGFFGQMFAGASTMRKLMDATDRATVNMYDNAAATKKAEAELARLQARGDDTSKNIYIQSSYFQVQEYVKALKAAKAEQDKLMGASAVDPNMNDGVTASGRAREQYNTQRAKDLEAANAFRLKQSGVPDGYLKDMAELIRLNQAGVLVGNEYTEALKHQQEELLKKTGVTKAANAGLKQEQGAYEGLMASIRAKIAEDQLELKGGVALTESQRMRIKLDEDLATGRLKLNATHEKAVRLALDELAVSEASVTASKTLTKGNLEAAQAREKYLASLSAGLDKLKADTLAQQEQNDRLGLSKLAIASLDAAKLEMLATDVELQAIKAMDKNLDEQAYTALKQQAEAYRELAKLKRDGAVKQDMLDTAKATADEWKRTAESIERTITDSLMRGFESGKGFAANLRDTIVNMFKTLVLRPIISAVVNPVAATITGAMGFSSAANAAGAVSSGANLLSGGGAGMYTSGAAGLYSTGAQVYSMGLESLGNGMMSLGNWAASNASALQTFGNGLGYASAAISAFKGNWGAAAGAAIGTYLGGPIGATLGNFLGGLIDSAFAGESRSGGQYGVAYGGQVTNNRRGETYQYVGQQFNRDNSTGQRVTNGQSYLMEADGLGATADAVINKAVAGAAETIDKTLAALGSKFQTTGYWAGLETSGKGRGGVFAGGSLTGGVGFGESGKGDNTAGTLYEKWSTQSPDAATAMANFTLDLKQSVVQALQAATDIPTTIKTMLTDDAGKLLEVESMTAEQVDALLKSIDNQILAVQTLQQVADMLPLQNLKKLSFDASSELIKLAGGLDTLTSQAQSYYQNFYSASEQTDNTLGNIKTSLKSVGLELPTTRDGFRALVEAQDLNTESGRKAYAALMAVSAAFASVTPAAEGAAKRTASDISSERTNLQDQLDQLTMSNTDLLKKQREALDESNRAIFDQIQAEKKAQSVKAERTGLQDQLDQLTLTNAQLLEKQRAALDESNRAIFDQIQAEKKAASIKAERTGLQDQLDQLTLTNAELLAKQRAALDESNRAIFDQIQAEKKAAEVKSQRATLQDEYDQLTMTSAQLLDKQRNALDESNRALFDQVQAQKKATAVASERASLQTQLDQALGNTAALRAAELAKLDESNRALQERIWAIADARAAADAAYSALEASINKQRTALQQTASIAQEAVSTIGSIYETLKSNVADLYNSVASTQGQGKAQALAFIDQALAGARATGSLPEGQALTDAIAAARNGLSDSNTFASAFEQQRAQLILAGKLADLQTIAGVQKSVAQQQLDAANDQLSKLDDTLAYWKQQLDISNGTYKATLSVADAIKDLSAAILKVNAATGTGTASASGGGAGSTSGGSSSGFSAGPGSGSAPTALTGEEANLASIRGYFLSTYDLSNRAGSLAKIAQTAKEYNVTQARLAKAVGWNEDEMQRLFASAGIPAFAVGTNYVPSDMLAMIHQGEAIVPKAYNPAANGVLQSDGQVAQLLTALIAEVQELRASSSRTANAVEGNQSTPLIVEVVNTVSVKGTV